jgi:hypothetical protein
LKTEFNDIVQDIHVLKQNPEPDMANTLILSMEQYLTSTTLYDLIEDPTIAIKRIYLKPIKSKTLFFIYKVHCCRFSNYLYELPGKSIWYNYSEIFQKESSYKYIIVYASHILFDNTLCCKLKETFPNCHIYVFVWDTLIEDNTYWNIRHRIQAKEVNKVLTFDKSDADKYGWLQCLFYYSKINIPQKDITTDLYFAGAPNGNRSELINNCYHYLSKAISCEFNVNVSKRKNTFSDGINILERRVPYIQILREIQSCNCVLEIVKEGQTGPTLRYFEAICYNKKLLTNNPEVVNLPFYDERYIHVFKTASDIDADWVARREPIDYHYDGRFSPIHMIELVRKLSEN